MSAFFELQFLRRFSTQLRDIGMENATQVEHDLLMKICKDLDDELIGPNMELRSHLETEELEQIPLLMRDRFHLLPQPMQEMDREAAILGFIVLFRRYRRERARAGHHRDYLQGNVPRNLLEEIAPPMGFRASPGPLPNAAGSWMMGLLQFQNGQLQPLGQQEYISQEDLPQEARRRVPKRWGPISAFWSVPLLGIPEGEMWELTQEWERAHEARFSGLVARCFNLHNGLLVTADQNQKEMLNILQHATANIFQDWEEFTRRSKEWYLVQWHVANFSEEEMQAHSTDGVIKRGLKELQEHESLSLQRLEVKLIAKSDWVVFLYENPPTPEISRELTEWNEAGFDFGHALTSYNARVDIVRARPDGDYDISLIHLCQCLVDLTDPLEWSQNDLWINISFLVLRKLERLLLADAVEGQSGAHRSLWWSPKRFELADISSRDGQTRLTNQNVFLQAVTNSYTGDWASFIGPRGVDGRHGPFVDGQCPRFTIIVRYD
ncbi:hypothetical protein PENSTE_c005G04874 [Penicillium steckii]|uniref:Uncharacterized protein n=1 Tax=Penicillium steckii TaxID=303698 RepID=A0A1V6TLX6_9EURO|nr:hypothetical protein PENSTE_c005G04874 [Penicillium steckii]